MSSVDPNKRNGWSSCRKVEDGWRVGWQQKRRDADFLVRVFGAFFLMVSVGRPNLIR